jgi:hypothetical protein
MIRFGLMTSALVFALAACSPPAATAPAGAEKPVASAPAFVDKIEPGEWRTTITIGSINAPGLPPGMAKQMAASAPTVVTDCVTSADVAEFGRKTVTQDETCSRNDVTFSGGKIAGQMVCESEGHSMTSTYAGSYTATRMEMAASVESELGKAGKMTSKVAIVSERLGACKT